jgi:hypothetical protein
MQHAAHTPCASLRLNAEREPAPNHRTRFAFVSTTKASAVLPRAAHLSARRSLGLPRCRRCLAIQPPANQAQFENLSFTSSNPSSPRSQKYARPGQNGTRILLVLLERAHRDNDGTNAREDTTGATLWCGSAGSQVARVSWSAVHTSYCVVSGHAAGGLAAACVCAAQTGRNGAASRAIVAAWIQPCRGLSYNG